MKPASFAYARPGDLATALDLVAGDKGVTKVIAGGQSIGPMLNLRLVQPDLVIDISGVPELRRANLEGDRLVLGSCVTHSDIEDGRVPDVTGGAMARVASAIAYRAVRNRGTVGGSLAHADPAADWVTALSALEAEVELASREGRRRLSLSEFLVGALDVALRPGELVVSVRVPAVPSNARWGYVKHCRKVGEFAHAIGCVLIDPVAGRGRAVLGAVEAPPVVIPDARTLFGGRIGPDFASRFNPSVAHAALAAAGMTDAVDRHVHVTVLARAVQQAGGQPVATLARAAA
jgi:carbon-monoxide dehydrogenase medium subunit